VTLLGGAYGPTLPNNWALVGVADFDGNGSPDYVLYNAGTRQTAIWYLNNFQLTRGAFGPTLPGGWTLIALYYCARQMTTAVRRRRSEDCG
jgi:hypothetical protein